MTTTRPTLTAEHREVTGKKVNRLRKDGKLPAVVYGHGVDSTNVTVDAHEFDLLRKHTGPNTLIDLSVGGAKAQPVLVNQVQIHPVHRRPLHADVVALLLQGVLDPASDGVLVFDDQDGGGHGGMLHRDRAWPRSPRRTSRGILRSRSGRLAIPAPPASRGPIPHTHHTP